MMTQSEQLELGIFRLADAYDKGRWKPTCVSTLASALQFSEWGILVDAIDDLHARQCLEIRMWDATRNGWLMYDGQDKDEYLYRDFYFRVSFAGRKYFERLQAQAAEESRLDRMPVAALLSASEHQASFRELKEAHSDLTKRPEPDLTGVVQHCMAALECTAKLIARNDGGTFGDVLKQRNLNLPPQLSEMLKKAWGFASDRGRHVNDGRSVSYPDAELMLNLCEAVIVYLLRSSEDSGKTP
jgi:hypothetical protein